MVQCRVVSTPCSFFSSACFALVCDHMCMHSPSACISPNKIQRHSHPQTLARSWRIGHFILKDYLQMPLDGTAFPTGSSAREISSSEAAALAEAMLVTSTETDANPATLPTMLSTKLSMRPSSMTGSRQLHSILRRKGDLEPRRTRAGVSFTVSEGSMSVESSMSTCSMEANPSKESEAPEEPFTRLASIYEACLAGGWDVVAPHESGLASATLSWAKDAAGRAVRRVVLDPGGVLYDTDHMVQEFYILLEGPLVIERRISERKCIEAALIPVGSLVAAGAFLSATSTRGKVWAGTQRCVLVAIGEKELAVLMGAPPIRTNSSGSVPPPDFVTPVPAAVVGDRGGLARNSPFALSFVMEESASEVLAAGPDILDTSPSEDSSALAKQPSDAEQRTVSLAVDLLLAASRSLSPMARHFASLGLRQVWYSAGEVVYRQGDLADALYVVISGRARMVYSPPSGTGKMTIEGEAGRGDTIGALLTLNGSTHNTTCLCARDLEAVRMTQASFELLTVARPKAAARVLQGMAQRLAMGVASSHRGSAVLAGSSFPVNVPVSASSTVRDIATIAILPAGITDDDTAGQEVVASLAHALSMELESAYGRTTLVDSDMIKKLFPDEVDLLDTPFFRAKVTAWLSKKEEDSRFIILQGDASNLAWSKICADQADCCLLAASPWYTDPDIGPLEDKLVWHSAKRSMALTHKTVSMLHRTPEALSRWADASLEDHLAEVLTTAPVTEDGFKDLSSLRRVELVLVYARGDKPEGTSAWLDQRPLLTRHHHIRLHRPGDLARLGRWMAGRAVGIVFSGGGSRGLAHLGVLQALKEAEVPVDVLGGTSQGAFMAGLAAHDFDLEELKARVKKYADHVGSVWNILWDLTPPLLAVLTGGGLNKGVKLAYSDGCSKIEDLWLRFFCVTTNLTAGKAHVHERGTLWRAVRASMSLIGLVPPVVVDGQVLCDGGYSGEHRLQPFSSSFQVCAKWAPLSISVPPT